jgi:hypothetical protein
MSPFAAAPRPFGAPVRLRFISLRQTPGPSRIAQWPHDDYCAAQLTAADDIGYQPPFAPIGAAVRTPQQ